MQKRLLCLYAVVCLLVGLPSTLCLGTENLEGPGMLSAGAFERISGASRLRGVPAPGLASPADPSVVHGKRQTTGLADAPWPTFRHDNAHTGRSPSNGPQASDLLWSTPTQDIIESSAAIGPDGTIYVGSYDGNLYALDPLTGDKMWVFATDGAIDSSPAIGSDGTIYIGSNDGRLYAIRADGTEKWEFPTEDMISCSPTIASEGTIYIGSYDHYFYAVNPDGSMKWSFRTYIGFDRWYSTAAIGPDKTVYVGGLDGNVYALNPADGSEIWHYTTGAKIYSSPSLGSNGALYIGSSDGYVYALNMSDGQLRWKFKTDASTYSSPATALDGTVYAGSHDGHLYALDSANGTQKWKFTAGGAIASSPCIGADGTVYVGSYDHNLYAIDPTDGGEKWRFTADDGIHSSPSIGADGVLYVGSYDKNMYAIGNQSENHTISGTITSGGAPLSGVSVKLTGDSSGSTTTGASGFYSFSKPNGSYTVTPVKSGYSFTPANHPVTVAGADVTGIDFTASLVKHTISGTITSGGAPLSGVSVKLTGDSSGSTTTGASGFYSFSRPNGSYTVTPVKSGFSFTPASYSVTVAGADVTGKNFRARLVKYTISGTITSGGAPLSGVSVKLTGDSSARVTTRSDGTFRFSEPNGSYTVTPTRRDCAFSPSNYAVTVAGADEPEKDFVGIPEVATVVIRLPGAGKSSSRNAYRMIGIPVIPNNPDTFHTLAKFFGGSSDPSVWKLFRSNYAQITRAGQDAIRYGKGWWLVSSRAKTLTIAGRPDAEDFQCALTSTYQMVACPYADASVSWTKVYNDPENSSLGLVSTIYTWNGSGEYASVTVMKPGQSYWVQSAGTGRLRIKRSHVVFSSAASAVSPQTAESSSGATAAAAGGSGAQSLQPPPLAPGATVTLLSPTGGEKIHPGQVYGIRWKSRGISPQGIVSTVNVAYSTDGGNAWATVAEGVPNSGLYWWEVPGVASKRCRVRVTSVQYPEIGDESAKSFSIE